MALSWSMDKVGVLCRFVEDCAVVFDAIRGPDGQDQSVVVAPFGYQPDVSLAELRIGYLESAFERDHFGKDQGLASLGVLRDLGAELVPIALPDYPAEAMRFILLVEAAAAFDELTRSGRDDQMVQQGRYAWPNSFRAARLIPAVEYIQANRLRYLLVQDTAKLMDRIDVYVAPAFGEHLTLSNLTGHPAVVVPNGLASGTPPQSGQPRGGPQTRSPVPTSITFIGRLYDEATVLAVAKAYQDATDFHVKHPAEFD